MDAKSVDGEAVDDAAGANVNADADLMDRVVEQLQEDAADIVRSSIDRPIEATNLGFRMLSKMGWKAGTGLGKYEQGRVDPVLISFKDDTWGVGKQEEYDYYHAASTARRKELESIVIGNETDEQRVKREEEVARKEAIKSDVKAAMASFYCKLCDKQYSKISEYETHLSSYDHNHKKRFKDMLEMTKKSGLGASGTLADPDNRRRERERNREERELRKQMAAAGIVVPAAASAASAAQADPAAVPREVSDISSNRVDEDRTPAAAATGSGSGGWKQAVPDTDNSTASKRGWSSLESAPGQPEEPPTPAPTDGQTAPAAPKVSFGLGSSSSSSGTKRGKLSFAFKK
ncbi:uncharacterized protein BJ171DRAFT_490632 [Polychytrium aggregatum]|uniref:uncharacterized protein n=1 Tax=Polychytrium aggregatum TaxID=110093 RepID=UPI0022FDB280|nr:uncharacterized protein BJ171DRAFT_490632 [Polychytrium aggregatum]KAI9208204.1 hypothetical protein BJ171DRAFT_490632 [Polychytrium aggregatum]